MSRDIILPIFGCLFSEKESKNNYFNKVLLGKRNVSINIHIENINLTKNIVDELVSFFKNLPIIKENLDKQILYNFNHGDIVNDYIEFHLKNIDEEIENIIGGENNIHKIKQKLISRIQLDKINIYPDNLEDYASFDYSITEDTSNHVVVFLLDEKGLINYIGMES